MALVEVVALDHRVVLTARLATTIADATGLAPQLPASVDDTDVLAPIRRNVAATARAQRELDGGLVSSKSAINGAGGERQRHRPRHGGAASLDRCHGAWASVRGPSSLTALDDQENVEAESLLGEAHEPLPLLA